MINSHLSEWVADLQKEKGMWAVLDPQEGKFHLNPALAKLAGAHGVNGCSRQIIASATSRVKRFEGEINGRRVVVTAMTDNPSGLKDGHPVIVARVKLKA